MKKCRLIIFLAVISQACSNSNLSTNNVVEITTNITEQGTPVTVSVFAGKSYHHPTFSVWIEDISGNYIETILVTKYLATGVYGHGSIGKNRWDNKPGPANRPATLPYWLHKRAKAENLPLMPDATHPVPDAITGATPQADFILNSKIKSGLPDKFKILLEINIPWDYNETWINEKYPNDFNYKTSAQPALIYAVTIDKNDLDKTYYLNPIGHSHYSGNDGQLYTNLTSFTSALRIIESAQVKF